MSLKSRIINLDNEIGYYRRMQRYAPDPVYYQIGDKLQEADTRKRRLAVLSMLNEYAIAIGIKPKKIVSVKSSINVKKWVLIFRLSIITIWLFSMAFLFYQGATCLTEHKDEEGYFVCGWTVIGILDIVIGGLLIFCVCVFGGDNLEDKLKRVNRRRSKYA